ncbi:ATP-binding cassette long-chain fatty acid transporter pxa2 [Coemansia spiralis]|uniref:ATP-binding cassette long-chain fatty acid transporter pxa2 n=2 Tax=Coemansia TaxID=4863 RepID=A0A9W8KVP3_9FUNG|nr:hypothetical protein BX070DRAFT_222993 [Coemansia spiralis]KAJ1988050.1 ATP-binding cassette long-chain fatty acid transporter pxa2 [Coemansia umbellata]KAJ2619503.1 ATP-binding cassette long-chain fatty acid transporter pxa2 [Coemansia sp. RSA 1358]KAJ2671491.1 ATP-binding cassette long-chain fatty acid transporter pxa2 [Coemansia spiralis]
MADSTHTEGPASTRALDAPAHKQTTEDALAKLVRGHHTLVDTRQRLLGSSFTYIGPCPYIKPSSLWELLIFPDDKARSVRRGITERHLAAVLKFLDSTIANDWGQVVDWSKRLGPAELFNVSVCRALYHRPSFVVIDRVDHRLFAAMNRHHITMLMVGDPGVFRCEFSRVLTDSLGGQEGPPAFDVSKEPDWLWNAVETPSLQRRASTLSQCSTTERRWLMSPDLDDRRQSTRLISPALTARSSVSDFSLQQSPEFGSRIDGKLNGLFASLSAGPTKRAPLSFVSPPLTARSASTEDTIDPAPLDHGKAVQDETADTAGEHLCDKDPSPNNSPRCDEKIEPAVAPEPEDVKEAKFVNPYARSRSYKRSSLDPGHRLSLHAVPPSPVPSFIPTAANPDQPRPFSRMDLPSPLLATDPPNSGLKSGTQPTRLYARSPRAIAGGGSPSRIPQPRGAHNLPPGSSVHSVSSQSTSPSLSVDELADALSKL